MNSNILWECRLESDGGFSVVMAEKVLSLAHGLGLWEQWRELPLGRPSRRITSYTPPQRIGALLCGLACGLRGLAPSNLLVRPNRALQSRLGGRFPDQGTMHRWLSAATAEQAAALRRHLHKTVRRHGRYVRELFAAERLFVDLDGQGLVARGRRFERAKVGWLGEGLERGFQRYVAYVGRTREVLDALLLPGNVTLMSALELLTEGLNEVFAKGQRGQVVLRADSHAGTVANLRRLRQAGYHFLCPPQAHAAKTRLIAQVKGLRARRFRFTDSAGRKRQVEYWVLPRWRLSGRREHGSIVLWATVYRDATPGVSDPWSVLLSDLEELTGATAYEDYRARGGAIEEYNDQSERAYHLDVLRTSRLEGLNVVEALAGLCWNLTCWSLEELRLPPVLAPAAPPSAWVPAFRMDLSQVLQRASYSGLRLFRRAPQEPLEIEDLARTPESAAWRRWLHQPHQIYLPLAG